MLWYYPGTCGKSFGVKEETSEEADSDGFPLVQAKELLALKETLHTEWDKPLIREQVADFIRVRISTALHGTQVPTLHHGDDVRLRKPLVSYLPRRWGQGAVDLLVKNIGTQPLTLRRFRIGQSVKSKLDFAPQSLDGLDEVSVAELDGLVLEPGEGRRLFTEEKERWEARHKKKVISRITIDCAFGIVQDWLVGSTKKRAASRKTHKSPDTDL